MPEAEAREMPGAGERLEGGAWGEARPEAEAREMPGGEEQLEARA